LFWGPGGAGLKGLEVGVGAGLNGRGHVIDQLVRLAVNVDQALAELVGVAGGEADALDAGDLGDVFEQHGEVGDLGGVPHATTEAVEVLAPHGAIVHALIGQGRNVGETVVKSVSDRIANGIMTTIRSAAVPDLMSRDGYGSINGMLGFHHREPGTAGAVMDLDGLAFAVTAAGFHVHEAALRVWLKCQGPDGNALITEPISPYGQPEG